MNSKEHTLYCGASSPAHRSAFARCCHHCMAYKGKVGGGASIAQRACNSIATGRRCRWGDDNKNIIKGGALRLRYLCAVC